MVENHHKTSAFAQNQHQRMAFLKVGMTLDQINDQICVLGVDILAPSAEAVGPSQHRRLDQRHEEAMRLARAPVSVQGRKNFTEPELSKTFMGLVAQ